MKVTQMTGTLDLIENSISSMSKGHKAIAGFILESYDKAAYMTAAKLGEEVGVSESTVVRFTTELGFEGYPEFQKALQEDLKSKLTSVQRLGLTERFESDSEDFNTGSYQCYWYAVCGLQRVLLY